ncbi:MAG: type II toxin-antitoxin system RelE/ParE family toxin [Deltaproteobacteria bacterium]|nr:type II toxin-antitoxin system RelE/ParE family toxin [Deltaproteobacteria bacterium]
MKLFESNKYKEDFRKLPDEIQRKTIKALRLLIADIHHPSLRVKKVKGPAIEGLSNLLEARINKDYRLFFSIIPETYVLIACGKHDKYLK